MDLKLKSTSIIDTGRAERLAKQFVSHWGRLTTPEEDDGGVTMRFAAMEGWPATAVRVEVQPSQLIITAWADELDALEENCTSIADHLHRFAGKHETLRIDWT